MPLPIDNLTTLQFDAATDDPSQARVEILNTINKVKEIIAVLDDGAGSGINADLLAGLSSASFSRTDATSTISSGDNSYYIFGPSATLGAKLRVGYYTNTLPASTGQVAISDGNLHIDSSTGAFATHLNYFAGTSGTKFGNGASGVVASVNAAGVGTFSGIEHTSHPVAGYVKVGTGIYRKNTIAAVSLVNGNLSAIAAPAGAKGLILILSVKVLSLAGTGNLSCLIQGYSDSAGTAECFRIEQEAFAVTGDNLSGKTNTTETILPVISPGNAYVKLSFAASGAGSYSIVGYTV